MTTLEQEKAQSTKDILQTQDAAADIWGELVKKHGNQVAIEHWESISSAKTFLFPGAQVAFSYGAAPDGEKIAGVISGIIGELVGWSVGAQQAANSLGMKAVAAKIGASIAYGTVADPIVRGIIDDNIIDHFIPDPQRNRYEAFEIIDGDEYKFAIETTQDGSVIRELKSADTELRIVESTTASGSEQRTFSINGNGVGFNQDGQTWVFTEDGSFFEEAVVGQDISAEALSILNDIDLLTDSYARPVDEENIDWENAVVNVNGNLYAIDTTNTKAIVNDQGDQIRYIKGEIGVSYDLGNNSVTPGDDLQLFVVDNQNYQIRYTSPDLSASNMTLEVLNGQLYVDFPYDDFEGAQRVQKIVSPGGFFDSWEVDGQPISILQEQHINDLLGTVDQEVQDFLVRMQGAATDPQTQQINEAYALLQGFQSNLSTNGASLYGIRAAVNEKPDISISYVSGEYYVGDEIVVPTIVGYDPQDTNTIRINGFDARVDTALATWSSATNAPRTVVGDNGIRRVEQDTIYRETPNGNAVIKRFSFAADEDGNITDEAIPVVIVMELDADNNVIGTRTEFVDGGKNIHTVHELTDEDGAGAAIIREKLTTPDGQEKIENVIEVPNEFLQVTFQEAANTLGNVLATRLADDNVYKEVIYSTFLKTALSEGGDFLAVVIQAGDLGKVLDGTYNDPNENTVMEDPDFADKFFANLNNKTSSVLSSIVLKEVGIDDFDGVVGEVTNVVLGGAATEVISESIDFVFQGLNIPTFADGTFDFNFDSIDITGLVAAYAGNRLAGEVITPESEAAAILGNFGGAVAAKLTAVPIQSAITALLGTTIPGVGIAIGYFVGNVLGSLAGNLLGSDDEPQAWAQIKYNYDAVNGAFVVGNSWAMDGGDASAAASLAQSAMNGINDIIEASGGKLREGARAPSIQIGFEGSEYRVSVNGGAMKSFGTPADAVMHAAFKMMKNFDLVGGDAVAIRAWHNSEATTIYEMLEDMHVADAFQLYLANPFGVITLMANDPDSEEAQNWAAILKRANELELHLPHEKDFDGGWGEILLAGGFDPSVIPSIGDADNLVITDPVTGKETIVHHVIGPGYEIVRIEGTDGNDIIEVIVDGPSISYVDGGAGDDLLEGSEDVDVLYGGIGDDTINGNGGNDWLHGGQGDDTIDGGAGEDLVVGGQNNDYLIGSGDTDHIYGNEGDDILEGGDGQDFLYGGKGNDILKPGNNFSDYAYGEEGDDVLYGGVGNHPNLIGGVGNDTYILGIDEAKANIIIGRGHGHDIVEGTSGGLTHLRFDDTISINELFVQQESDDLIIHVLGEDQSVTVRDYFGSDTNAHVNILLEAANGTFDAIYNGGARNGIIHLKNNDDTVSGDPSSQHNSISDSALSAGRSEPESNWGWVNGKAVFFTGANNTYVGRPIDYSYAYGAQTPWYHVAANTGRFTYNNYDEFYVHAGGSEPRPYASGRLYAGAGNDVVDFRSAFSNVYPYKIYGDSGNDTIYLGKKNDIGVGGLGNDKVYGYNGNDQLFGSSGNDVVSGGNHNDLVVGGADDDSLYGGSGDDEIKGDHGVDSISGGAGNDIIYGGIGSDTILGEAGNDSIYGGAGDDNITGGDDIDTIEGGGGNDTLDGGADDDWISGGDGDDIIDGGDGDDTIAGEDGNDNIIGGAGLDTIDAGSGDDTIDGGADDDSIRAGYGADIIDGGSGDDTIAGEDGDDEISGGDGIDNIDGGAGNDTIEAGDGDDTVTGWTGNDTIDGGWGNDTISGHDGDDTLIGGVGDDIIDGGLGEDVIDGGLGSDTINGGAHNDTIIGDDTVDTVDGGQGSDTIDYSASASGLTIDLVNNVVSGGDAEGDSLTSIENIIGSNGGGDTLLGNDEANSFWGNAGDDILEGAAGADVLDGGNGADHLKGGSGDDTLIFDSGDSAGATPDLIEGNVGTDTLVLRLTAVEAATASILADIAHYEANIATYQTSFFAIDSLNLEVSGIEAIQVETREVLFGTIGNDIIYGTAENNTIFGGNGDDELNGLEGNDIINGGDDDDLILGRDGNDALRGDDGDDTLYGDGGDDLLTAHAGNDTAYGGDGNDELHGHDGNDDLRGGTGNDIVYGGDGDDALRGDSGNDQLHGGAGIDLLIGHGGDDIAYGGDGVDTFHGQDGDDAFHGGNGDDKAYGGAGDDILRGNTGNDLLRGDAGNDFLIGHEGDDDIFGGADNDLIYGESGEDNITGGSGLDKIHGGDDNDTLYGNAGADLLYGNQGDDRIYGNEDNDILIGAEGSDTIDGGTGNDTLNGGSEKDYLYAREGNDVINAGTGDDLGYGAEGLDILYGGDGADLLDGGDDDDEIYGEAGNDRLFGGLGDDQIDGGDGADYIAGNEGNDILIGGAAIDKLFGDDGDDIIQGDSGADELFGGAGNDQLNGGLGADTLIGGEDDDEIYGGHDNDVIHGGTGLDILYGENGEDRIYGNAGNDTIDGGNSNDLLYGGDDNDTVFGGNGDDLLRGELGDDSLYGNDGIDQLYGADGDDELYAGAGADRLQGDAGADLFILSGADAFDGNINRVVDFSTSDGDVVKIDDLIGYDPLTSAIEDFVTITESGSNTIISIDRDGTAGTHSSYQAIKVEGVTGQWTDTADMIAQGDLIAA